MWIPQGHRLQEAYAHSEKRVDPLRLDPSAAKKAEDDGVQNPGAVT
jgi:hypothetical protein